MRGLAALIGVLVALGSAGWGPAQPPLLIAPEQFVYAPAETEWDIAAALRALNSPLEPFAGDIELYSLRSSVDPRVLLAVLELQGDYVTGAAPATPAAVYALLEETSRQLATAFYASRAQTSAAGISAPNAGAQALESVLGAAAPAFSATASRLFPDFDPLDASNSLDAPAMPADLLQFPFPISESWYFNGAHGWSGYDLPLSSIDFSRVWLPCGLPSYADVVVAAGAGTLRRPDSSAECWLEIDHAGGWTTSYYHLTNVLRTSGWVEANTPLAHVGCETCAGGFATASHMHLSLKYHGAYTSLEGVTLSGWTIHPGPVAYSTDTALEREGFSLKVYARVLNDAGQCTLANAPTLIEPSHGALLPDPEITLQWKAPAGAPTPSAYRVRVRTSPDVSGAGGANLIDERVSTSSLSFLLPDGYFGQEIFWSAQAWSQGACSSWATPFQFRLPNGPALLERRSLLPLLVKGLAR